MADNFEFRITGASLEKSLDIATTQWSKVVGWSTDSNGKRLVLYWTTTKQPGFYPLPAPLERNEIVEFVRAWLKSVDYGPEPDHDGDNGKGWTVYNERWGHVANRYEAFVAIEPTWMMYGK